MARRYNRIKYFALLIIIIAVSISVNNALAFETANDNRIWLYSQAGGSGSEIACKSSSGKSSTLKSSGCQVYTYAHAIQWLTGEKRNKSNHKDLLNDILA